MDFALAKNLKDTGFPQMLDKKDRYSFFDGPDTTGEDCYAPTLSELIEACGEDFNGLDREVDSKEMEVYWVGKAWSLDRNTHGSTPEEAVARLWLALNK